MMDKYLNKIINGDAIEVMDNMPENSIDLMVTSPRYNVGIDYDIASDEDSMEEYWNWTRQWLTSVYRVLKKDGRVAINVPYEVNVRERGGRVFFASEFWQIMKEVGYKFYGLVDLYESSPHRSKTTAWGSWMSPSAPYIYNPKECIVLAYKEKHIKEVKGTPQWEGTPTMKEDKNGNVKSKLEYSDEDKNDFMSLVYGQWEYFADTKQMTKATFSMDIPRNAIKILTYKEDIVMDPFCGSGTSCLAAELLERRWIGIDISESYCNTARSRIANFQLEKEQLEIEFKGEK